MQILGIIGSGSLIQPVTTGLLSYWDAGNSSSYSGGSTWTDLSGNGRNLTLSNTSSGGSGTQTYVNFNGTSSKAALGSNLLGNGQTQSSTISVWVYNNNLSGNREWASEWDSSTSGNAFFLGTSGTNVRYGDYFGYAAGLSTGTWYNYVGVNDVSGNNAYQYRNGSLVATKGSKLSHTGTANFFLGVQGTLNDEWYDGRMAICMAYNRALTSTEITQNFNAFKSRYGL
jgi:hypothetical protein